MVGAGSFIAPHRGAVQNIDKYIYSSQGSVCPNCAILPHQRGNKVSRTRSVRKKKNIKTTQRSLVDMEKLTFVTVLLLAGLNAALARDEQVYFVIGGKLNLRPSVSERISSLLWKHDGNLVAEVVEGRIDEHYGSFKGRTNMNKTTGSLEITGMTEADAGVYTVEVNYKDQGLRFNAVSINEVPKPAVLVRPAACSPDSQNCTLTCDGETEGVEPVDYIWNLGGGKWRKLTKVITITKRNAMCANTFTCRMKNPVSERESEPQDNPFSVEKREIKFSFLVRAMCEIIIKHYFPNSTNLNSS